MVTSATLLLRFFITPITIVVFWKEARQIALGVFRCKVQWHESQSQGGVAISVVNLQGASDPPLVG